MPPPEAYQILSEYSRNISIGKIHDHLPTGDMEDVKNVLKAVGFIDEELI